MQLVPRTAFTFYLVEKDKRVRRILHEDTPDGLGLENGAMIEVTDDGFYSCYPEQWATLSRNAAEAVRLSKEARREAAGAAGAR